MASRACGNLLSLRNQMDTKTPRETPGAGRFAEQWTQGRAGPLRIFRELLATK
jgi:hypothetical protein